MIHVIARDFSDCVRIGAVVKVGYREALWPADQPDAPYQVSLH